MKECEAVWSVRLLRKEALSVLNMSDRSLVAPIALGIALTGWPAARNADGNLGIIFSDIVTSSPRIN